MKIRKSYLSDVEKKELMDMFHKYKDGFSLTGEISMCPNIKL